MHSVLLLNRINPNSIWLVTSRHNERVEPMHFGFVELVEQHSSTRLTRRTRHVERVETWRTKWNLGLTECIILFSTEWEKPDHIQRWFHIGGTGTWRFFRRPAYPSICPHLCGTHWAGGTDNGGSLPDPWQPNPRRPAHWAAEERYVTIDATFCP